MSEMLSLLNAPGFAVFSIAGIVILALAMMETIGLIFGHSISALLDGAFHFDGAHLNLDHADHDAGSPLSIHAPEGLFSGAMDWLNAGRVPLLVLLMTAITGFAAGGLTLQILASHLFLTPLPYPVAIPVAFLVSIPATRFMSRLVAKILPRDETYVITPKDLVGRIGVVTLGPLEIGSPGRAKVMDRHGNAHFPEVEPAREGLVIAQGVEVIVVDAANRVLTVVPAAERQIAQTA